MKTDLVSRLNPKISNMSGSSGGFGGLTTSEISQSMAGLNDSETALAYAIHGHEGSRKSLVQYLMYAIKEKINQDLGKKYLEIICQIAIHEEVGESICLECGGRGVIYRAIENPDEALKTNEDGLLPVDCKATSCVDGSYSMSNQERLMLIGEAIDKDLGLKDWNRGIAWDYSEALSQLSDWKNKIESHIGRRLS